MVADVDVGLDDVAQFGFAVGACDHATVVDGSGAIDFNGGAARDRVDLEADVISPNAGEQFDVAGVERAGFGTSVYFYFKRGKAEQREPNPFFPAHYEVIRLFHAMPILIEALWSA